MLGPIKRWMNGGPPGPDWRALVAWAKQRGHQFKRVRDGEGFAIEGQFPELRGIKWRLEWGPPQRPYIPTRELRVRAEVELNSGLQMLVLSGALFEQLEHDTFELYTETMQTRIDSSTPEEMRWLAMFPKVQLSQVRAVRLHFAAVASVPQMAERWLSGALGAQLAQARIGLLAAQAPFLLMTQRTRVQMRVECEFPGAREIEQAMALFETALREALALRAERDGESAGPSEGGWPTGSEPA
jgi:hypothetical protein